MSEPQRMPMLALTLWRPWDFCFPPKDIENRPRKPWERVIGTRIALHAGQHYDYDGAEIIKRIMGIDVIPDRQAGVIVATTRVRGWIEVEGEPGNLIIKRTSEMPPALIGRAVLSPWLFGPFGWVVTDTFVLPKPVPCRGKQGLWALEPGREALVRAQLPNGYQ